MKLASMSSDETTQAQYHPACKSTTTNTYSSLINMANSTNCLASHLQTTSKMTFNLVCRIYEVKISLLLHNRNVHRKTYSSFWSSRHMLYKYNVNQTTRMLQ